MTRSNLLATSALLALGFSVQQAHAQVGPAEAPDAPAPQARIETIVVTAQKQEQELIEVPINISVADQALLDLLNTDDIEEYADFVPGLQVQAQSLNAPSYSLRGVTNDGGGARVAVFQNGVAIANPGYGANLAMFDLERIEVVKGPQATLFGQGALVGGVNFIQNRATLEKDEGYAKLDLGDYNYVRAELGYNMVLTDTFALRFAGQLKNRDGYVPNLGNSPDLMGQDTFAIRAAAHWEPTDNLAWDVFVNRQEDDSTGTQFKSGTFAPAGGDLSPYTATAMNVNEFQLRPKLGNDREVFSTTSNIAWDLTDAWTLTSLTDYRDLNSVEAYDSDGAVFDLLQFGSINKAQAWSQELRMNYDAGGPLSAFFGANYYNLNTSGVLQLSTDEARAQALLSGTILQGVRAALGMPTLTMAQFKGLLASRGVPGAANFDNIVNPMRVSALGLLQLNRVIPLTGFHVEGQSTTSETTAYDLFGDVSYDITDRLTVTGGLRYTKEELAATSLSYLVRGNPALGGVRNGVTLGTTIIGTNTNGVPNARDYDGDGSLTWRLNAAYRISQDLNTWVAIGRGRRPEALTADATEPTGFAVVEEETFDNIEVGLSGLFLEDRMRLTASTYYGEYKNFQTARFDTALGFITENSGNATQYGVEFDTQFIVSDNITLFGTYGYNFSEYDDTDDDGNALQYAGNSFRLSPLNSFSIGADFRVPVGAGDVFFVPTYVWKDDLYFEDDNDPIEFQEAYGILDLKLGWEHKSGAWGANVYLENALDEEYLIDVGNTGGAFGIPTYIRGIPQMFGAGAYVKF
jgi:iron complex outermembrane receptor protein